MLAIQAPKVNDYKYPPYIAMTTMQVASQTKVYPEDTPLLDNEESRRQHREKLKEAMQCATARYRMEWLQQLSTDESTHLISVCRRKLLALLEPKQQLEELDKTIANSTTKMAEMQANYKEHQEILDRLQQHMTKQKQGMDALEACREEVRQGIRAAEDAAEQLRKAQHQATDDPYNMDYAEQPRAQSSPFAQASSDSGDSAAFTRPAATSPFTDSGELHQLRSTFSAKIQQQESRADAMQNQLQAIHTMLMQMASHMPTPAPTASPPTAAPPPTPTSMPEPTPTSPASRKGPTGTPVATSPGESSERLPARTSIQQATMPNGVAREERAAAAQEASKAARAASVEAKRHHPPPPQDFSTEVIDSDDEVHQDGTGQGM